MKTKINRILCLLLAAMMLCSMLTLAACAEPDEEQKDPSDQTAEDDEKNPEEDKKEEVVRLPIDYLPEETYDGAQIHVLEWTVNDNPTLRVPWEEIDVDAPTGALLEDAVYDRNATVEEKFDVVITKEYIDINGSPNYITVFRSNEQSGDQMFQMATTITARMATFCMEAMMTNMNELENLHTDMPWWNQDSVRSFTMGDALFLAAPEMLLRDKGATSCVFYNHKIAADNEISDLYEMARAGDWTLEELLSLAEQVAADVDGDDVISSAEDMYGFTGGPRDIPYYLFTGSGNRFAVIDDDGYLDMTFGDDEENIIIWQDVVDMVLASDCYYANAVDEMLIPAGYDPFRADRVLFQMDLVRSVVVLRHMETDYGVLPTPKYDSYQEDYASLVWMHHDSVLGIPASVTNTDVVSAVLEYMSYLSYYDIYPVFYETVLSDRSMRDEESVEMLEIIFRTRTFDPGHYWLEYELHNANSFLTLFEDGTENIASLWAQLSPRAEKKVEEFNEFIDELSY